MVINRPGNEFFARPAFAGDEDGRVRLRDLPNQLEDLLHRFAFADDAFGIILLVQQRLVTHHLPHVTRGLQCRLDQEFQLGDFERFEHVVVGAELHRLDRRLRRAVRGHHDHQQLRVKRPQLAQRL